MDTSGLSTMIWTRIVVQKRGGEVKLINLPPRIYDLLVSTKLTALFDIVQSESDAVKRFEVKT
jgi:anti-sigma B factor antagonist